jgi:hypothetical protein
MRWVTNRDNMRNKNLVRGTNHDYKNETQNLASVNQNHDTL